MIIMALALSSMTANAQSLIPVTDIFGVDLNNSGSTFPSVYVTPAGTMQTTYIENLIDGDKDFVTTTDLNGVYYFSPGGQPYGPNEYSAAEHIGDEFHLVFDGFYDVSQFTLTNDALTGGGTRDGMQSYSLRFYDGGGSLLATRGVFAGNTGGPTTEIFTSVTGAKSAGVVLESTWRDPPASVNRFPLQLTELEFFGTPSAVPEPTSTLLLGIGSLLLLTRRRR